MKNTLGILLLAGSLAPACNNKLPEQNGSGTPSAEAAPIPAAALAEPAPEPAPEPEPVDPAKIEGEVHAVWNLLHNRPLAHTRHQSDNGSGALFADLGAPGAVRYLAGNHAGDWTFLEIEGRKAAALRKTRNGTVWLPSPIKDDATFEAEVFNPANQPNKLTLVVNGKKTDSVSVEPGWQTVKVAVPREAMAWENEVVLEFASMGRIDGNLSGGAVAKLRLGASVESSLSEGVDVASAQDALAVTPKSGGAMWTAWALKDSRVKLAVKGPETCAVDVAWAHEKGGEVVELGRKEATNGEVWVDPRVSGELIRFEIVPNSETCSEGVVVEAADLVLPGAAPQLPKGQAPKHVLFWMVDTLRSDHLPLHFDTDVQAPNLTKLAAEGASFKLAYVQGNESRCSHASLFSGLYPNQHGVLARGHLKPHHHLLPEAMKDNGYKAYAFISNGYVSEPWGFVQGWDMYRNNLREGFGIDGAAMAKHALDWATKYKDENFLLYVGTIDPHVTYRAHDEYIGLYDDVDYSGPYRRALLGTTLGEIATGKVSVNDRDKQRIKALYKNEITFNDKAFGDLRAGLEALGTWEDTMVIITGDHGDQFWEHGGVGHGSGVHQEVVHVPLIIYYPPLIPAGTVVEAGADVLDIYPTVLDALGAKTRPDVLQGQSVLPLIHRVRGDYPEPAIATHYTSRYGVQMQQWKLVAKKGSHEIYDRRSDPEEQNDVKGRHPLAERWLQDSFGWFRAHRDKWKKSVHGPASNLSSEFLSSLGEK